MEFKGTKGKWILNWSGGNPCQNLLQIISENNIEVCNFGDSELYYPTEGKEPNEYDALLISKAPEMLEKIKEFIENFYENKEPTISFVNELENLVKSATSLEV